MNHRDPPLERAAVSLRGTRGSISAARRRTEEFLAQLRSPVPQLVALDAVLLVSELVTNAVRHAPGPCWLNLLCDDQCLVIAVTDTSRQAPRRRAPDLVRGSGGLGMHLLDRLATATTVQIHDEGKTVTAVLSTAPRA